MLCQILDSTPKVLALLDHGRYWDLGTLMKKLLKLFLLLHCHNQLPLPHSRRGHAQPSFTLGHTGSTDWSLGLAAVGEAIAKSRSHFDIAFCGSV